MDVAKLLARVEELEKKLATADAEKKVELQKEISQARTELSAAIKASEELSKKLADAEAKNKKLEEAQIDAELSAMVSDGRVSEEQKAIARSLMMAGKKKEVEELFSKPSPFKTQAKPAAGAKASNSTAKSRVKVVSYSEFSLLPREAQIELVKEMSNEDFSKRPVIADDLHGPQRGLPSPLDIAKSVHQFERASDGMTEFASYDAGVSQTLSGSNLLPKVWEAKAIYDLGNLNFGFAAVALKATTASAYQVQWNIVGTLATQGTSIHQGTTTGTNALVITPVTMNPQWYGNSVNWEGNVGDWSVTNIQSNIVYPALLRDYNITIDTECIKALLAAHATVDGNTVLGGTWSNGGVGTLQLGSIGTFNDTCTFNPQVALVAKTILAKNGAMRFDNDFICFASPEQLYSIGIGTQWISAMQYADTTRLISGEIGKWMGIRFVEHGQLGAITATQRKTAAGTGTSHTAIMLGMQALGKGFDIDFNLTYYPDYAFDAGRFRKLLWNSRGGVARLKVNELVPIVTCHAGVFAN